MRIRNPFADLSRFELVLWLGSMAAVVISFIISPQSILSFIASLIGATALIFVAKGYVLGQVLTVVFAVFYGIVSYEMRYYGEMITYLCMTSPMALAAVFSWLKNPYGQSREVRLTRVEHITVSLAAFSCLACLYFCKATALLQISGFTFQKNSSE